MTYHFNVTGPERIRLSDAVSRILGIEKKYMRAPSFAFQIGALTVSKDGTISSNGDPQFEALEGMLIDQLADEGFTVQSQENAMMMLTEEKEMAGVTEEKISIAMPRAMMDEPAIENLKRLVEAKGKLMKRAFRTDELPVEIDDEKISFPWFPAGSSADEIKAYTFFIQRICEMAILQKRINRSEREVVNEKYEFRCFLLRLGMIGADYKAQRKILLCNLSGSSAFKSGSKAEA